MKTEELLRYRAMYHEMRARLGARYIVYAFRPAASGALNETQLQADEEVGSERVENGSKPCESL